MHPLIENNREAIARLCRVHPDARTRTRNSPPNLQAAGSNRVWIFPFINSLFLLSFYQCW
jgi:hypothetical protein